MCAVAVLSTPAAWGTRPGSPGPQQAVEAASGAAYKLWVGTSHLPVAVPSGTASRENTETLTIELLRCPAGVQGRDACAPVEGGRIVLDFLNAASLPFVTLDELERRGNSFTTTIRTVNPSQTHVDLGALRVAAASSGNTSRPSIRLRVRGYVDGASKPTADGMVEIPLDLGSTGRAIGEERPSTPQAAAAPVTLAGGFPRSPAGRNRGAPAGRFEPGSPKGSETPAHPANGTSPPLRYFVVHDAATRTLVVIAGRKGLRSGDRIVEVHGSLEEAVGALRRSKGEAPSIPLAPAPAPSQARSGPGVMASAAAAPAQTADTRGSETAIPANPQLAAPGTVVTLGGSRALILSSGVAWILEAGPEGPEHAYLTRVPAGLTEVLTAQPLTMTPVYRGGHVAGSLLAFRNRLGDALFFDPTDRAPRLWQHQRVFFQSQIRVSPGSVLLLPREDEGGVTVGVYVYHFPSGTALYCTSFRHSLQRAPARRIEGLPKVSSLPCTIPALRRGGATRSYLLLDGARGAVWSVLNVRSHPFTPRTRKTSMDLRSAMHIPGGRHLQLAAAPLLKRDRSSDRALLFEGATGVFAILEGTGRTTPPALRVIPGPGMAGPGSGKRPWRPLVLPLRDRLAFWLLDLNDGRLALVQLDRSANSASIRPVRVDLR